MQFELTKANRICCPITHYLKFCASLLLLSCAVASAGCGLKNQGTDSIPAEVEETISTISDDLAWERYDKIYNESSSLWKRDTTDEQSAEVLKRLRTQLGKVENRTLHTATEQRNSGGPLQGHVFIVTYQTKFEHGEGMETFTLLEENGSWALARYFVNSTALK
jgi:Protein of unknown function (DUF4019)